MKTMQSFNQFFFFDEPNQIQSASFLRQILLCTNAWHDAKSESSSSFGLHEGGGKGGEGGGLAGGGGLGSGAHGKGGGGSSGGDGGNEGDTQNWHEWHAHHGQCWCLALAMHHERHSETAQWPVASGR